MGRYKDRRHAGRGLAEALREYAGRPDVVMLALPRGGVPVAYEVARRLGAPLAREVDDIVCAATPEPFVSVGLWYESFEQTSDDEVRQLLEAAERELGERGHGATPAQGP